MTADLGPECARYGAWWATVKRVDVRVLPDKPPLWFWHVGHDGAGPLWSGHEVTRDAAVASARRQFDAMTRPGADR